MPKLDVRYREYSENVSPHVVKTYSDILRNQTLSYVLSMKQKYKYSFIKKNIWETLDSLDYIIDESDPDNDLPQIVHAYQTAESLYSRYLNLNNSIQEIFIKDIFNLYEWNNLPRKYKELYSNKTLKNFYRNIKRWDWLPLIGFIHDLGKVLLLPTFGELPQWSVVGDTLPIGYPLSIHFPFYSKGFHKDNVDINGNNKIYSNKCGFEKIHMSWGHDEYLSMVLERSNTKFPKEAIYIVRFHSFYSWHTPNLDSYRTYQDLASDYDWEMLPLLKAFQKADLYSKSRQIPKVDEIKKKYNYLINAYLVDKNLNW